jgi:hypothetical protein
MSIHAGFLHRTTETDAEADADAGDEAPPQAAGWWELAALVVLTIGATGVPVIGWLVGMSMVGLSDAWTERDKTIAAVAPAGVVAALVVVAAIMQRNGTLEVLGLGPLTLLALLGGAVAGLLGSAYLAVRAVFCTYRARASRSGTVE